MSDEAVLTLVRVCIKTENINKDLARGSQHKDDVAVSIILCYHYKAAGVDYTIPLVRAGPQLLETLRCRTATRRRRQNKICSNKQLYKKLVFCYEWYQFNTA